MEIELPVREARLLRRYKRFLADVELPDGEVLTVHCADPGSMRGCLAEGAPVVLRDSQNPRRKLRYTLQAIEVGGSWVNVDTSLPNGVVSEAIEAGLVEPLGDYDRLRREVPYGERARIDILLERELGERCYVEVKSSSWVVDGVARFPDAVTERGRRHLVELARVAAAGDRAVVFFCVGRSDAETLAPADEIDPRFGATLREVVAGGVEVLAYRCRVEPTEVVLSARIPVEL